jgi:hypothetical protein
MSGRNVNLLVAACALGLLHLAASGCGGEAGTPADTGVWERAPRGPLSPRHGATAIWTGSEVLIVGGDVASPCPAGASCARRREPRRDGAAFDPGTGSWRTIAEAPTPIVAGLSEPVVVGDTVYHLLPTGLLA